MTLKQITRGFLFEGVSNDDITNAIKKHKYVVINYEGTDGTHNGFRMIQPVAFGCTSAGNPVVRAYEPFGDTKTKVPRWKYFRVDRISSWKESEKSFSEVDSAFNPKGDGSMGVVYVISDLDSDEDEISSAPTSSPKMKSDEKPQTFKTETERGLDRLRKQLENPLTLSDFKTQNAFGNYDGSSQKSGPKTNKDVKKGTDSVYTDDYNYNVFDNSLNAAGSKAKRNGNYYFQKRGNGGRFTNGSVLDEPEIDDSAEVEDYLNRDNGNAQSIKDLIKGLGDTSEPISFQELQKLLKQK